MNDTTRLPGRCATAALLVLAAGLAGAQGRNVRTADYIVAVVNQELVTAGEIEQRVTRARADAQRSGIGLPPESQLRQQMVDALIEERVIVTYARDSGMRVDEAELDRAVNNIAAQNQITIEQLRERLRRSGIDYVRFRSNVREQMMIERIREREVQARIRVTDGEIDAFLDKQRLATRSAVEINIAQILVTVPDGASASEVAARRARIDAALMRGSTR